METATVRVELDKRSTRKNGTQSVKLVVYFGGVKNRYSLKYHLTPEQWDKMNGDRLRDEDLKEVRKQINLQKGKAEKIVEALGSDFDFADFESRFLGKLPKEVKDFTDVYKIFESYISDLRTAQRIGNANAYETAMKSFKAFAPSLKCKRITPVFLEGYEKYMLDKGRTTTTVGMYMRALRTILNIAKDKEIITAKEYPFGSKPKKKYEIPEGRNIKKALKREELQQIRDDADMSDEARYARDIWLFSFYCNGMNMADICQLRYRDVQDGFIHFLRSKTKRTQKDKTPIEVYLSEPARKIIEEWGSKPEDPNKYIFPAINDAMTAEEKHTANKNFTRSVNQYMETLSNKLELPVKVTTYMARHTYATLLKHMGTSIEEISESLGHSNIKTTKNYLASFPQEKKRETAEKLVALL
ncbi:MAG: site-specific integrase [Rikenellaceae bacterium]|nr:site-specific integrase [Rikenellaceae bacterium]